MSCYFEKRSKAFLSKYLNRAGTGVVSKFLKLTKTVSILKISFFSLFFAEVMLAWFFISYFPTSFIIAVNLGAIVLTVFLYFSTLFYLQSKKPSQLKELEDRFISQCRQCTTTPKGSAEHHLSVASALLGLSQNLAGIEESYFKGKFFKGFFEKLSLYLHQEDVFKMRERLLFAALEEHIKQIKSTPLDVEVHVSLANSYVILSKLYIDMGDRSSSKRAKIYKKRFKVASEKAIEEFMILKSFAPNDPWILAQLANNYHTLGMLEEETLEYEALLEISDDDEVMFRLGKSYFALGRNAQGLQIYDTLVKRGYKRGRELLFSYSATMGLEE